MAVNWTVLAAVARAIYFVLQLKLLLWCHHLRIAAVRCRSRIDTELRQAHLFVVCRFLVTFCNSSLRLLLLLLVGPTSRVRLLVRPSFLDDRFESTPLRLALQ